MELTIDQQARGCRIITGQEATDRRELLGKLIAIAGAFNFSEIILPTVEPASIYTEKAGAEVLSQMYAFEDKAGRELCLRPEGTATIQALARTHWKTQEKRLWYFERCYRYERPQAGRYREFFQFGVEWINPPNYVSEAIIHIAQSMVNCVPAEYELHKGVKRGLSYYTDAGFEITCEKLGAQKQVCGGGPYAEGIGFAIGFDRLMMCR